MPHKTNTTKTTTRGKSPGKSHREGMTLMRLFQRFPDEKTAIKWFEDTRWQWFPLLAMLAVGSNC